MMGNTYDTDISEEEKLYKRLCAPQYKDRPYEQRDLGENMTLVNQVIGQYWKPVTCWIMKRNAHTSSCLLMRCCKL